MDYIQLVVVIEKLQNGNIEKYCDENNKDENIVKQEVFGLAVEVARRIYTTGEENWIKKYGSSN